jgi:hypothetical protein
MKLSLADRQLDFVVELLKTLDWVGTEMQIISATPGLPPQVQAKLLSRSALCCGLAAESKATMPFKIKLLRNSEVAAKRSPAASRGTRSALEQALDGPLGEGGGDHPDQQTLPYGA